MQISDKQKIQYTVDNIYFFRHEMYQHKGKIDDAYLMKCGEDYISGTILETMFDDFVNLRCEGKICVDSYLQFFSFLTFSGERIINSDIMQEKTFNDEQKQ